MHGISSEKEPEQRELYLSSPAVKHFYICRKQLLYKDGLLYYKWKEEAGDRLLLMVADKLKQEVMSLNHGIPLSGHMGVIAYCQEKDDTIQTLFKWSSGKV